MGQFAKQEEVIGKSIAAILRSDWEQDAGSQYCHFYLQLADGTLVTTEMYVLGSEEIEAEEHQHVEFCQDNARMYCADDFTGVDSKIDQVLLNEFGDCWIVLEEKRYLHAVDDEGGDYLALLTHNEFLDYARVTEFVDYWTKHAVVIDNLRAIDIVVRSDGDLELFDGRLSLDVGIVRDGNVATSLSKTCDQTADGWKTRFVVPEPGVYEVAVSGRSTRILIDDSVIAAGSVDVHF